MSNLKQYELAISQFIPLEERSLYFYWKGRVALFALLRAIGLKEHDDVVLPGLTCVVVPNAILYLGARPVYVDVSVKTCNATFEAIIAAVTDRTKAIIVQNTFGLSSDVDRISSWAKERGIYTIEDCTHGFGGTFNGKPNGSYCDAAIYSTQWNKPYSTGVGGFCIVSNKTLNAKLVHVNKELLMPTLLENVQLRFLLLLHKYLLSNSTYWILLHLYRFLSKIGLVIGSSSGEEVQGISMPKYYFKGASPVQFNEGIGKIKRLGVVLEHRRKNAHKYTAILSANGKYHVDSALNDNHSFLKYPILVKNRADFIKKAERCKIKLGDWFISPLHPANSPLDAWLIDEKHIPNATFLANHLLNLPTDEINVEPVLNFINSNIDDFLDFR